MQLKRRRRCLRAVQACKQVARHHIQAERTEPNMLLVRLSHPYILTGICYPPTAEAPEAGLNHYSMWGVLVGVDAICFGMFDNEANGVKAILQRDREFVLR